MAEKHSKSKLKRKKDNQADIQRTMHNATSTAFGAKRVDSSKLNQGSTVPTKARWWTRENLSSLEDLWASMLRSAVPCLEAEQWGLVPELPQPSIAALPCLLSELQQREPVDDVQPFPEPSRPQSSPSNSHSFSLEPQLVSPAQSSQARALSELATPSCTGRWNDAEDPEPTVGTCGSRQWADGEEASHRRPAPRPLPPLPENRPPTTSHMPEVHGIKRQRAGRDERLLEGAAEEGASGVSRGGAAIRSVGGDGRLHCCPMCMMAFPERFSQMDCDSHLAQCLSEMNVDMTW